MQLPDDRRRLVWTDAMKEDDADRVDLAQQVGAIVAAATAWRDPEYERRAEAEERTLGLENRFTPEALAFAVNQQMHALTVEALLAALGGRRASTARVVGVLNPGNVPLVELQDFLAVVLSGHRYRGALSSRSPYLLPAFVEEVREAGANIDVAFVEAEQLFSESEAVIVAGTDDTRAWAEALCDRHGVHPSNRLLRGNRFAVAILDGSETENELEALAEDALLHEGFGCRNVAIIWAPDDLSPDAVLNAFANFRGVFPAHPDTPGALAMQKAFLEAVGRPHAYGEGLEFLVSKGDPEPQAPGHVRWSSYADVAEPVAWAKANRNALQLIVTNERRVPLIDPDLPVEAFGNAQRPPINWQPDGIDTMTFLLNLSARAR